MSFGDGIVFHTNNDSDFIHDIRIILAEFEKKNGDQPQ